MFKSINRNAIIVTPKKTFRDWAAYIIKETPVAHLYPDPYTDKGVSIYLIPEIFDEEKKIEYIKKNYKKIFAEELLLWIADEDLWPQKRTWKVFCDWFDISYQQIIMDTVKDPIKNY